ncbi:Signal transduction histidine kinase [Lutibacter oricola]|uniref:histidine kinase n=1 Tax=Lutibacter oricola TaxID=762486 RepID=A0A1H3AKA3_9FLAO|nr:hybrid sensor histidine kinase/response regulator transcription factor [Lutibacter oricola]SDX29249.1 Signal transduction histidine kinase [Lutibacter oricola]
MRNKFTYWPLVILLVVGFLFTNSSFAQSSISFDHLSTKNGLSQNDVNAIYQDNKGFMWFGTHDGLNRYDGYNFSIYKPKANDNYSINSTLIWNIVGDNNGNLWIGTTGNGLNYFDKTTEKFKHITHNDKDENSLNNDYVKHVFLDNEKRLWVSTRTGLDVVDVSKSLDSLKFDHFKLSRDNFKSAKGYCTITFIFQDSQNQILIGGPKGLFKVVKDKQGNYNFQNLNVSLNWAPTSIRGIREDEFGRLLITSFNGLHIVDLKEQTHKLLKVPLRGGNNIAVGNGHIWVGGTEGLYHFENSEKNQKPKFLNQYTYDPKSTISSLSKNEVTSLFVDKTGIVWIGTNGGGVNIFDPESKQFKLIQKTSDLNSLSNDNIRSIFEDSNGTLWVGTEGGGLNILKKEDSKNYNKFINIKKVANPFVIKEIKRGDKKFVLVGGQNSPGIFKVDITNFTNISETSLTPLFSGISSVFSLLEDSSQNLWVGTYSTGVIRCLKSDSIGDYKRDILSNNINNNKSISNDIIRDIVEDRKGNIWFATGNGLSRLTKKETSKKNPKFRIYKNIKDDEHSISHNYILSIYESDKGEMWFGTFGGGLNKLIRSVDGKSDSFKVYSEKDGLPNNVIKGILEDNDGNLWLSTNKGLSKFNPNTEVFKNYDTNDGLQNDEFGELAHFKKSNGEMMFGGVSGFNSFFPDEIKDNSVKAETVITSFSIFNKPIGINEEVNGRVILNKSINEIDQIDLEYKENSFSFEFAALHYAAPQKNKYAYKLEGFNNDWIYTSSEKRFATYTNLEPGLYTLKVKASNNDGLWDESPSILKINVIPPFWRTSFAKLIYVLLFVGSLFLFRRFTIIRSTKKHQLELEHLEKDKYEEIQRLKLEFFTNISHEFRTPLTLIKGPLEYLQKKGDNVEPQKVQEQYSLMHKNIDYLLRLVNQLLDFRKMDKGKMSLTVGKSDLIDFIKVVGEPFQFLSSKKDIDFKINAKSKELRTWFDPDAVEKIMNNLLSNAFKFTPEKGTVEIEIIEGINYTAPEGLKTKTDKSNYVVIQVKDSGPGIPKHRINFIFERFYVDRDVRKINSEGSGIGLAFTKKLVELHRGSIDVVSDETQGTNFVVWLPKDKQSYENINDISFSDVLESQTFINEMNAEVHAVGVFDDIVDQNLSRSRSKLPILLVVDDNADIRGVIKQGLGEFYDIYEAENGERGFELAKKLVPNIVLTDILMPVMDGIEFCNKLKTVQETSHIPVVMLTAKTSQEWEIEGLRTGADAYIRKPFDMELLELKLQNILKHREELRKRFNRKTTLQPNEVTVTSTDEKFLQKAIDIVEKHMMNSEFSVELLVKEMSLSRSNLYLKIKELTGLSSSEFIRNIRLKRAVQLLEKSDLSVKEIMYMTGFNTASYFSKCFKKQFGVIPSKYVRQGVTEEEGEAKNDK